MPEANAVAVTAKVSGTVVEVSTVEGSAVTRGQPVVVLESMKLHYPVPAEVDGTVTLVVVAVGDLVDDGAPLVFIQPGEPRQPAPEEVAPTVAGSRTDLAEALERNAALLDAARPEAVARRREQGRRTARENVDDLLDAGSFREYGGLAVAAQRARFPVEELRRRSPADGVVTGFGTVEGAACAVLAYDETVLAGTQGWLGHKKTDRFLAVAEQSRTPVVMFAEGGGGRPGDTDPVAATGLDLPTFHTWARLSGLVPRIAVVAGRCFAGNAVLFGCADVTIATRDATIGMGGPAMIEGGGLGTFRPEEVGPAEVLAASGVVDVLVDDEPDAVRVTKAIFGMFHGRQARWACPDQHALRNAVPERRLTGYNIRDVVAMLADTGSFVELRREFGRCLLTGFVRLAGRPLGLIANDPQHLGGAIDADGADKAARFMQLCDAFGLPVLSLVDCPGFMVGPDSERAGAVRHGSRLFVTAASMSVPFLTVVLRKAYGLGAQAMSGGSLHASRFTVSWPTGEFGAMGIEGAVSLAYRRELAANPERFNELVAQLYERGKALSVAQFVEIDAVIDPASTRDWVTGTLDGLPVTRGPRRFVDTW